jgi:hypothetical protein
MTPDVRSSVRDVTAAEKALGTARHHGVGEALARRQAVAPGGGRPGTPEVHAQVLSMRKCMGRRGRASAFRCGASSLSSMVTNGGCARPTSQQRPSASLPVRCPRSRRDARHRECPTHRPQGVPVIPQLAYSSTPYSATSPPGYGPTMARRERESLEQSSTRATSHIVKDD